MPTSFDAGEFTPTLLIGALVPVIMAITVLFALSQQGSGGFVHGRRVVSYAFGVFGAVIAAGPGAADAQTPSNQRVHAVSAEHPVPRLMSSVLPRHPGAEFRPIVVAVRVTVDERGHVSDVRPLGPAREKYVFYVSHPTGGEVVARAPYMSGPPPWTHRSERSWSPYARLFARGSTSLRVVGGSRST